MATRLFLGTNEVTWGGATPSTPVTAREWIRPSDWLPMPDTSSITGSAGAFYGLYAVYTGSNFVNLSANGAFTVNWGDGVSQSFAAGATASYIHTYDSLSPSSYSSGSDGYGSGSGIGYRQAMITIVPSGSGVTLNTIDLQKKHPRAGLPSVPSVPWLDIAVGGQNLNILNIGSNAGTSVVELTPMERCNIGAITSSKNNITNLFDNCHSLQSVGYFDTSNITIFQFLFNNCFSLQSVPLFDTSKGTNFTSMFSNCYSLQSVPLFDTSKGTTFSSMFNGCVSLQSVPLFNLSSGSTFSSMFQGCNSLIEVPLFNLSSGSIFTNMFYNCPSLQSVPLFDTSKGTNFGYMFYSCYSLQSVPLFDTSKGTTFSSMFNGCVSLQSVPLFNLSNGSTFTNMFNGCNSLIEVPSLNVSSPNQTGSGLFATMYSGCTNLRRAAMSGSRATIDYSNCYLGRNELVEIFDNLSITGSIPCSITCSGNHGVVDLTAADTASVIAKGWTIKTT